MESNVCPRRIKKDFFQKWPRTLWEGQTDLSGPFLALFDQFYDYTGYRIPDTGHRYTGRAKIRPMFGCVAFFLWPFPGLQPTSLWVASRATCLLELTRNRWRAYAG